MPGDKSQRKTRRDALQEIANDIKAKGLNVEAKLKPFLKSKVTRYSPALAAYYQHHLRLTKARIQGEQNRRKAFSNLLEAIANLYGFTLIEEEPQSTKDKDHGDNLKRPDGQIRTLGGIPRIIGWWEASAPREIEAKIQQKKDAGYDLENILFEDSGTIVVLYQNGQEVRKSKITDPAAVADLLAQFFSEAGRIEKRFREESREFCGRIPQIAEQLKDMIRRTESSDSIQDATVQISKLMGGKNSISPADVTEMLVQHILTGEVFRALYGQEIEQSNEIARSLKSLQHSVTGSVEGSTVMGEIRTYYQRINDLTLEARDHPDRAEQLLKDIYQEFYWAYSVKSGDKLGIVYTPQEIVNFMVRTADHLLKEHFEVGVEDPSVSILDPATGTGTFITSLMRWIVQEKKEGGISALARKYRCMKGTGALWANEVSILAYYVACIAIQRTLYNLTKGEIDEPFAGLCYQDTLTLPLFEVGTQIAMEGHGFSEENTRRVKQQRESQIDLVIGNPPWRAKQGNAMEMNTNAAYPALDKKITNLYKGSGAQKPSTKDQYKRFLIWALDRIRGHGMVVLITNRGFLMSTSDMALRQYLREQTDHLYITDLGGDVLNERADGNVFANNKTGCQITFAVKTGECKGNTLKYFRLLQDSSAEAKLKWLADREMTPRWQQIPSSGGDILAPPEKSTGFEQLPILVISKEYKNKGQSVEASLLQIAEPVSTEYKVKGQSLEVPLFRTYSGGVKSNRDDWAWDFDTYSLERKMAFFTKIYESERKRYKREQASLPGDLQNTVENRKNPSAFGARMIHKFLSKDIKWARELVMHMIQNSKIEHADHTIRSGLWRPFVKKILFYEDSVITVIGTMPSIFPMEDRKAKNLCINIVSPGEKHEMVPLMSDSIPDLHCLATNQCIPLYIYKDGKRSSNITYAGLQMFQEHYKGKVRGQITAEDIFYYVYAVLNDPEYQARYRGDLYKQLPRLPLHPEFWQWAQWGRELGKLHTEYEKMQIPEADVTVLGPARYPQNRELLRVCMDKTDKTTGERYLHLDSETKIRGIPESAWDYTLADRPALLWPLVEHKRKGRPGARQHWSPEVTRLSEYSWQTHRASLIKLLKKVIYVSVETQKICKEMGMREHQN